jgi:hypothetical protein
MLDRAGQGSSLGFDLDTNASTMGYTSLQIQQLIPGGCPRMGLDEFIVPIFY